MKGRSIRPPGQVGYARIVRSVRDSVLDDVSVPLPQAEEWLLHGALKPIDIGPMYPNSFMTAGYYPHSGLA